MTAVGIRPTACAGSVGVADRREPRPAELRPLTSLAIDIGMRIPSSPPERCENPLDSSLTYQIRLFETHSTTKNRRRLTGKPAAQPFGVLAAPRNQCDDSGRRTTRGQGQRRIENRPPGQKAPGGSKKTISNEHGSGGRPLDHGHGRAARQDCVAVVGRDLERVSRPTSGRKELAARATIEGPRGGGVANAAG